jgi:hypothetical protein
MVQKRIGRCPVFSRRFLTPDRFPTSVPVSARNCHGPKEFPSRTGRSCYREAGTRPAVPPLARRVRPIFFRGSIARRAAILPIPCPGIGSGSGGRVRSPSRGARSAGCLRPVATSPSRFRVSEHLLKWGPYLPCSLAGGFEDDGIAPPYKEHPPYPHTNKGLEMVPRAPAHLDVRDRRLRSSRAARTARASRPILALLAWGLPAWDTRRQRVHKCTPRLSLSLFRWRRLPYSHARTRTRS